MLILPRPGIGKLGIHRGRYASVLRLAKESLTERCTELPSDELLSKFVKLAIDEIQHGRHPGTKVRELINDPTKGKHFLFAFITKRMERHGLDLHLKFEFQPICVQMSARGEKFRAALVIQDSTPSPTTAADGPAPAATTETATLPVTPQLDPPEVVIIRPALTGKCVSDWLIRNVGPDDWYGIVTEAMYQLCFWRKNQIKNVTSGTIEAVQHACRPVTETSDRVEYINLTVDWLLDWTLEFEGNRSRLYCLLGEGLNQALASRKSLDNRPGMVDGFRYVAGIIDGTLRA